MKKKALIATSTLVLVLTGCGGGSSEESGETSGNSEEAVTLKFGTHLTDDHNLTTNAVEPWMEKVEEYSNGEITFEHYPNSQMGGAEDTYNLVENGTLDVGYTIYMEDALPLMDMPMLPNLYSDPADATNAYWDVLNQEPLVNELENIGVKPIMAVAWEPYTIATVEERPETLEELSNLKVRSSGGLHNEAAEALGMTPVAISASESLEALRKGTVDGYWGSTTSWIDYQFTEELQYGINNLPLNGWGGIFSMNYEVYDSLTASQQDAVDQANQEMNEQLGEYIKEYTREDAWNAAEEAGMEIYEVDQEVVTEIEEQLNPITEDWLQEQDEAGYPATEVYEQFQESYEAQQ